MGAGDRKRSVADSEGDPFGRSTPDVSGSEDPGHVVSTDKARDQSGANGPIWRRRRRSG